MKINLKQKHWDLGHHFVRFIDKRWYSDYTLEKHSLEAFIKSESYGVKFLTNDEIKLAEPLFNGKKNKEITLRMIHEEMAENWSQGMGWYPSILHTLREELWNHKRGQKDKIYINSLIKIIRSAKLSFINTLLSFSGITEEQKSNYINTWLSNNSMKV